MAIIVMVDGAASLSKAMLKKYNIAFLPYNFVFGSESYKNLIDINNQKELLNLINEYNCIPKISKSNKIDIENQFRKYIDNGNDILYLCMSSKLSNAYNEALEIRKKFDNAPIEIIDSLNIGSGQALLTLYAIEYINKGYGLKQTVKYLNKIKYCIKSCYLVGDSTYLYNHNKCDSLNKNYLQFCNRFPIAEIDNGEIILTFSAKSKDIALQVLRNTVADYHKYIEPNYFLISYSGDRKLATKLKQETAKLLKKINVDVVENNPIIYLNSGNNTVSVSFLLNKK